MSQCKWKQFTKQELEYIIENSKTKKEAVTKMGYTGNPSCFHVIQEISDYYNIPINHLIKKSWQSLIGQKFYRLKIIDRDYSRKGVYFLCECDCGNITSVRRDHLENGDIKSCGCYSIEVTKERDTIDLTNQFFGRLQAIKIDKQNTNRVHWLCKCSCGNPNLISVVGSDLRSGHTKSCGCLLSKGEEKIIQILAELKIPFEQQKTYNDLISDKGKLLRFDFYLPEYNCVIEYQGRQHYEDNKVIQSWNNANKYDTKKYQYCLDNNINYILISYKDYEKLDGNYIKEKLEEVYEK